MCVYIYIYIHIHIYTYTHTYTYICVCVCTYTHIRTDTYTHTHTHTQTYTHTRTRTRTHAHNKMKSGVLDEPQSASRNFLNGEIAEILIYNKALTTQVLLKLALLYFPHLFPFSQVVWLEF